MQSRFLVCLIIASLSSTGTSLTGCGVRETPAPDQPRAGLAPSSASATTQSDKAAVREETGRPQPLRIEDYSADIAYLTWSRDGTTLVSSGGIGRVGAGPKNLDLCRWDTDRWQQRSAQTIANAQVLACAVTGDGKLAALGGDDLTLWDCRATRSLGSKRPPAACCRSLSRRTAERWPPVTIQAPCDYGR